jgi:short-subunit dehydrogenase
VNRTALVTGASSGIGLELAKRFAADGFDLVLVARTGAALEELAQQVEERHGVRALVSPMDLARPEAPGLLASELRSRGVHVDALVNSAGFNQFGAFAESDERRMLELLHVNVDALTHLTRLLVPGMIERGWGRVANLASNAAFQPGPLMAVYYASKAYVLSLSIALAEELRGTGVTVTGLCPGPTATGFQSAAGMEDSKLVAGKTLPSAADVADWSYAVIKRGKPFAVQGARWRSVAFGTRLLPRTTVARLVMRAQERPPST